MYCRIFDKNINETSDILYSLVMFGGQNVLKQWFSDVRNGLYCVCHHTATVLWPFFWDHLGKPVPQDNFWTLRCKGILTEADTQTIRLGATLFGVTSAHLHHTPHIFYVSVRELW